MKPAQLALRIAAMGRISTHHVLWADLSTFHVLVLLVLIKAFLEEVNIISALQWGFKMGTDSQTSKLAKTGSLTLAGCRNSAFTHYSTLCPTPHLDISTQEPEYSQRTSVTIETILCWFLFKSKPQIHTWHCRTHKVNDWKSPQLSKSSLLCCGRFRIADLVAAFPVGGPGSWEPLTSLVMLSSTLKACLSFNGTVQT